VIAPITALFGALNATLNIALALDVLRRRNKEKVFLGSEQSPALHLATRRHANNAEYVPLALLTLLLAELCGGAPSILYALGGALTVGRVSHAIGLGEQPTAPRALGILLTFLAILGGALYSALLAWR
jgi:uncharacterized membrane protein YecN with MAPEG domain